jgi:hypothetical protein
MPSSKVRTVIECEFQEAMGPVQIQLATDILPVIIDSPDAQVQMVGDFFAGVILTY